MSRIILFMVMFSCLAFAFPGPPPGDDDDDKEVGDLLIEFTTSCKGNVVTVTDKDPVAGAEVDVYDDTTLAQILNDEPTDSNGQVTFEGCGKTVRIIASKESPPYKPYNIIRELIDCERCEPPCETDYDCPGIAGIAQCIEDDCVPTPCETDEDCPEYYGIAGLAQCIDDGCEPAPCETVEDCPTYAFAAIIQCEDDQCVPKPCEDDEDCPGNARCEDRRCVPPECEEDKDCRYPERCEEGRCEPGGCETDEDCIPYATAGIALQCIDEICTPQPCESDDDCPSNASCEDGRCVPRGCEKDEDCDDDEFCDIPEGQTDGACNPLTGRCGFAANHTWVEYECDDSCPCGAGQFCCNHVCFDYTMDTQVEDNEIVVSVAGIPPDCDYGVDSIDPEGEKDSRKPDESGEVRVPITKAGAYVVALVDKDGNVKEKKDVAIFPEEEEEEKDFLQMLMESVYFWAAVLVIILVLLYIYLRKRGTPLEPKGTEGT